MLKQQMIAAGKRRTTTIETAFGTVHLRSLTQRENELIQAKGEHTILWYLVYAMVDEDGNRIWGDHELGTLLDMDISVIQPLAQSVMEFCLEGASIEDAEKN